MDERLSKHFEFVRDDIEIYDKKPVLMDSYKCVMYQLNNKCATGETNCKGCEGLLQCCKFNIVIELFARFQMGFIKPENFQTSIQLIIKDCKTQTEVISVANSAIQ